MTDQNPFDVGEKWTPIGATRDPGSWSVLWGKHTEDGWTFREGSVGLEHIQPGTPSGVVAQDVDTTDRGEER